MKFLKEQKFLRNALSRALPYVHYHKTHPPQIISVRCRKVDSPLKLFAALPTTNDLII